MSKQDGKAVAQSETEVAAGSAGNEKGTMVVRLGRVRPMRPENQLQSVSRDLQPSDRLGIPHLPVKRSPRQQGVRLVENAGSINKLLKASKPRISGAAISFILLVLLPTILAGLYFSLIASPQYVSEFRFSVRLQEGASNASLTSSQNMLQMLSDNFIVADYVYSRDVVDGLESQVSLRSLYSRADIDWWSRFPADASVEDMVDYWQGHVSAHFDMTTGINTVEIRAFSADDAYKIASALQALCEKLVNKISEKSRQAEVQYAQDQLARAEKRVVEIREKETAFRTTQLTVDAVKRAEADMQLATKLRQELYGYKTEYNTITAYLSDESPRVKVLKSQIAAAEQQIAALESTVASSDATAVNRISGADAVAEAERLKVERTLAEKLYEAALESYEQARLRAVTNQTYLATYVQPGQPQDPSYPRVFFDTFIFFIAACGIWIVSTLIFYSIRDHAH